VTLAGLLEAAPGDRPALRIPGGATLGYDALRRASSELARRLAAEGVLPGDLVAASYPNGVEIVVAWFGVAAARAGYAPLNMAYTEQEFRFYLEDIRPKLLLLKPSGVPAARAAAAALGVPVLDVWFEADRVQAGSGSAAAPNGTTPPALDDDVALFLHTSGTTSRPKGVPLTHANLTASASNIQCWYGLGSEDVSYSEMPLFHVHGLVFSTLAHLAAGALVVIPERFSASAFWPHVREYGVTVVSAVPTIYRSLLPSPDSPRDFEPHSLRFMRSSSAPLPASMMERLETVFGVAVIEAYSMTEASHQMTANPLEGERRPGSVGMGAFVDVTILDEGGVPSGPGVVGEVAVRGPNVTRGYHNNPAANAQAFSSGWFRTGDWGVLSEDGYLTLVGRLKELINRAGEKISPVEVDDALLSHPGVTEAVSFSVPDEKYGEAVGAALVLKEGTTADDVLAHARARLAAFKVPTSVYVVESIPRTATGKVQRRAVAAAVRP
jgi:acyl-CoA synthetase (AMP-forming)/AMP-acid ligase II